MAVQLRILLILSGLTGIHGITTVTEVSVRAGDSISIPCLYGSQHKYNVKSLCKGQFWTLCSYKVRTNQINSNKFSISDDKKKRIFTVTIRDLTDHDTDYWCAAEGDGGSVVRARFQLSVTSGTPSLYVDHQQISAFKGDDLTINCYHHISGETKWCRLGSSCVTESSGFIDGTEVTINENPSVFTVTMSRLKIKSSGWYWCVKGNLQMPVQVTVHEQPATSTLATTTHLATVLPTLVKLTTGFAEKTPTKVQDEQHSASVDLNSLIISLCLLFFAMVTLFIWLLLKMHKQTRAASSAMTAAEDEVIYSTVDHKKKTTSQTSYTENDVDVMYSSVVAIRPKNVQKQVQANEENVTYSTLA